MQDKIKQFGKTTNMLHECIALIDGMDTEPVLVRAHNIRYANDLCTRFYDMAEQLGHIVEIKGNRTVIINNRAEFKFVSMIESMKLNGVFFREVFTDHYVYDREN